MTEPGRSPAPDAFYAPRPTHNPLRFVLPVERHLCVGPPDRKFMFGGVGLASSVTALEAATGRPLIWATAQYLSYAHPGAIVDIDVHHPVVGRSVSQARVVAHVGESEIITVNAALGRREELHSRQFAPMPEVPSPEACETREFDFREAKDLHDRFEMRPIPRVAHEDDGRSRMWIRPREPEPLTSGLLAVVADYVPSAIRSALDRPAGANSLDNTLRVVRIEPGARADWMLCDTQLFAIAAGFVHGRMHIFTRHGHLLATAGQSGILRVMGE
jgi:acyl-CoA thioesterase-2